MFPSRLHGDFDGTLTAVLFSCGRPIASGMVSCRLSPSVRVLGEWGFALLVAGGIASDHHPGLCWVNLAIAERADHAVGENRHRTPCHRRVLFRTDVHETYHRSDGGARSLLV